MTAVLLANVTAVAIAGRGLLIEGPPGSGKTSLALALIDRGAQLVGDDGVALSRVGDALHAAPPPATRGLCEVRNVGLVALPAVAAPLALVLALDPGAPRFPLEREERLLAGVALPLLRFAPGDAAQALRAEYALAEHGLPFPGADDGDTRSA